MLLFSWHCPKLIDFIWKESIWCLLICQGFSTVFATPRIIVYDNACNLHSYSLNRDPVFFKNSQFLVDWLHWHDHTGAKHSLYCLSGHHDGLNKVMISLYLYFLREHFCTMSFDCLKRCYCSCILLKGFKITSWSYESAVEIEMLFANWCRDCTELV